MVLLEFVLSLVLGQVWGHVLLLLDHFFFLAFTGTAPLLQKDPDVAWAWHLALNLNVVLCTFRHSSPGNHKMGLLKAF